MHVVPVRDIPGHDTGKVYDGYLIILKQLDIRDILNNANKTMYKAEIVAPNAVLITKPAMDYSDTTDANALAGKIYQQWTRNPVTNPSDDQINANPFVIAMDEARNSFNENRTKREWTHLLLQFDSSVTLSSEVLEQNKKNILPMKFLPIVVEVPELQPATAIVRNIPNPDPTVGGQVAAVEVYKYLITRMSWAVARVGQARDRTRSQQQQQSEEYQAVMSGITNLQF